MTPETRAITSPSSRALAIQRDAIVFDAHYDRLYATLEQAQGDLANLRAGGVTVHIRQSTADDLFPFIERTYEAAEAWPADVLVATRASDVRRAKSAGMVATILSIEGADPLRGDLTLLRLLYRLGLRNLGITWSTRNEAADGVFEARTGGGLTSFGVRLVEEAQRLGIMIDIAHLAPAGVRDVFEICDGPVIASHANAYALCAHCRNLNDHQIESVARSGGVVGVTLVPEFTAPDPTEATLKKLIDHIDHIVHLVGVEHVGLGTDWDGFAMPPNFYMRDISDLPVITDALMARGYPEDDIRKILGENFLRVFERVVGA